MKINLKSKKMKDLVFFLRYTRMEKMWLSINTGVGLDHTDYKEIKKVTVTMINPTVNIYDVRVNSLVNLFMLRLPLLMKKLSFKEIQMYVDISIRKSNILVIKSKPWLETQDYLVKPSYKLYEDELVSNLNHYYLKVTGEDKEALFNRSCIVLSSLTQPTDRAVCIGHRGNPGEDQIPVWRVNYKDYDVTVLADLYDGKYYQDLYPKTLFNKASMDMPHMDILPYAVVVDKEERLGLMYVINPPYNYLNLLLECMYYQPKVDTSLSDALDFLQEAGITVIKLDSSDGSLGQTKPDNIKIHGDVVVNMDELKGQAEL